MTTMSWPEITATRAIELLEGAVRLRGEDYVYKPTPAGRCLYVHQRNGAIEPGCLIGLALSLAGVPLESLTEWDDWHSPTADVMSPAFGASEEAADIFNVAQSVQDTFGSWGEALAAARRKLSELRDGG